VDFTYGDTRFTTLDTGEFRLDGGAMFGHVPKTLWDTKIKADADNCIPLGLRTLLVQGPNYKLLVDTGMGEKWDPALSMRFGLKVQSWDSLLGPLGLVTSDITHVLITHLHFDHAGGLTCFDQDKKLKSVFENAEVLVSQENFRLAKSPVLREKASYRSENWECLEKTGQLRMVSLGNSMGPKECVKGCWVIRSDGHTLGQQLPFFETSHGIVAFCGDLIPTFHHSPLTWGMGYDSNPSLLADEKQEFLQLAEAEKRILILEHDSNTEAVVVEKEKDSAGRERLVFRPESF